MTKSRGILPPREFWTAGELEILRDTYADVPTADIAALLGCSKTRVYCRAEKLGLSKSAEFKTSELSGRIQRGRQDPRMLATQFRAGQTSWNKGLHYMPGGAGEATRFKKGNISGRAAELVQPVGSYRVTSEGLLEQKTGTRPGPSHLRWTPVSRLVWVAAHGPVPKGHIVIFKPGKHTTVLEEITLERLECISRAENAIRNHPRSKHPELGRLVQLKGAITRQVNRIAREAGERNAA